MRQGRDTRAIVSPVDVDDILHQHEAPPPISQRLPDVRVSVPVSPQVLGATQSGFPQVGMIGVDYVVGPSARRVGGREGGVGAATAPAAVAVAADVVNVDARARQEEGLTVSSEIAQGAHQTKTPYFRNSPLIGRLRRRTLVQGVCRPPLIATPHNRTRTSTILPCRPPSYFPSP